MGKKNEKRLCWNCLGSVSAALNQCPYCGVDLETVEDSASTTELSSPFQRRAFEEEVSMTPPYGATQEFAVSEDEWNKAMENEQSGPAAQNEKNEMMGLLLLLPGVVFALFGLALMFFSQGGVLSLQWKESFSYYFLAGAAPLLYLGWRSLK